jgi:hypothetical protein
MTTSATSPDIAAGTSGLVRGLAGIRIADADSVGGKGANLGDSDICAEVFDEADAVVLAAAEQRILLESVRHRPDNEEERAHHG